MPPDQPFIQTPSTLHAWTVPADATTTLDLEGPPGAYCYRVAALNMVGEGPRSKVDAWTDCGVSSPLPGGLL